MSANQSCASRLLGVSLTLAVLLVPSAARAQVTTPPPSGTTCDIEEGKPSEVSTAYFELSRGATATGEARKKALMAAVKKAAEKAEQGANPVGRAAITARALVYMIGDTAMPLVTTRGAIGLVTNPDQPLDLIVAVDSLIRIVETAQPECVEEYAPYRQNQGWLTLLTIAQELMQKGDPASLDSAEKVINRSFIINKKSPYPYQFLASIWQQRLQMDKAAEQWRKVIDVSGTDSTNAEMKRQAYYYLATILVQEASADTNTARKVKNAREAAAYYRIYIQEDPKDAEVSTVRYNLGIALHVAGDTAQIPAIYAEILAKPDSFSSQDAFQAGRLAALVNKAGDAAALFSSVLKREPYNRDALFNASFAYIVDQKYEPVLDLGTRLLALDPTNPDNYDIFETYYSVASSRETDDAKKKPLVDSLIKYSAEKDKLPAKVEIQTFSKKEGSTTIGGTVINRTKEARAFEITFEFLNAQGNAVASETVKVSEGKSIEPDKVGTFSVVARLPAGDIVAYRYKPVK